MQQRGKECIKMGRISKRSCALRKAAAQQSGTKHDRQRYKAGIYARLSSDQGQKACGQSESLESQVEIAKKFVEEFNSQKTGEVIDIVEYYTDLGKTGSNFEREGFLWLLQDIRVGKINCVIVKDLSRFGRNYLEAGNYIEKIFPFLGVRFISVADGFDTGKEGNENEQMSTAMAVEIKNLVNDMYARDFSKKAKLHLKQRREEGSYVGGPPPYGYKADWNGKRRVLLPDEKTEAVVRLIYEKFAEMENYATVADELNRRRINPPNLYKKTGNVYHSSGETNDKGWDRRAVARILESETYAGTLVQGKTGITARNEKNRVQKPEEDWVVTKGAQEPLVGEELYKKAAEARQRIQTRTAAYMHPAEDCPLEENIFGSVLYCGVCGRKMTRSSYVKQYADGKKERLDSYFCPNTVCPESSRIARNALLDILLPLIHIVFAVFLDRPEQYMEYGKERPEETAKKTECKIRRFLEEEGSAYMDYHAGKILQEDYAVFRRMQEERRKELKKQQQEWEKEKNKLAAKYLAAIKALLKPKSGEDLTKDVVDAFISKIYVYPRKRIEVLFPFTTDSRKGGN